MGYSQREIICAKLRFFTLLVRHGWGIRNVKIDFPCLYGMITFQNRF